MPEKKRYWLVKSEEDAYSIDDLRADGKTCWEGIRNYAARNNLREMTVGDEVLFYHSNASPSGVVGVARVAREAYPDQFAFDPKSRYHDPKSDEANPRWFMVDLEFVRKLDRLVSLAEVKDDPALDEMALVRQPRLSVQPVEKKELERILELAARKG